MTFWSCTWGLAQGFKEIPSERRIYESTLVGQTKLSLIMCLKILNVSGAVLRKVLIVSRTVSGMFLVGPFHRPSWRKRPDRENRRQDRRKIPGKIWKVPHFWERGSGGVESTNVSQSVRETSRDGSQCVPLPEKLFKTRDLEIPIFEGSLPSCSPQSPGYTCTSVPPYFAVANSWIFSGFSRGKAAH